MPRRGEAAGPVRSAAWNDRGMPAAHGRVALVTGSTRGLGAVIARRLARDVARSIRDDGGAAEAFFADVTDEQQVAGLIAAITGRLGPVDVLVLNATGPQPEAPVIEVTWAGHLT